MATILVVDDNAPNREYLQTLLSYKGHRVIVAVDGREALPLIRSERPDLVIADLLMPNMDGFELTRAVRSDAALAHTAIIYCTATYHAREVEMLARSLGVLQIIDKPSEPEAILKLVDAVLTSSVPAAIPVSGLAFDEEHARLISEKLSAKMLQLEALNLRLEALTTVGQRLASELDPLCLLQAYCDHGREIFLAKQTTIGILSEDSQGISHFVSGGFEREPPSRPAIDQGIVHNLLTSRAPRRLRNPGGDAEALGLPADHQPITSYLGVPIASPSRVYGWLSLRNKLGADEFGDDDERVALMLAAQLAIAYENMQRYEALQSNSRRFRALVENSADAVTLVSADGSVLYTSPTTDRILGSDPNWWLSGNWLNRVHPDDLPRISHSFGQLAQTPGARASSTLRYRHMDGSWRWLEGTATNLLGEPSVGAIALNYRDITSRMRVADALTASEADFRALFAAMTDVVLVMDSEGRYLQIAPTNPALLYKPPAELLGRTLHEVLPETDADNILRSIRRALELQQPIHVEYGLTIGGAKIWFDGTVSPMGADKVFWIARDVTEHKQAMEALRASEQRFRGYFELGLIGMTIASPASGIIEVNAQLCDTLGYERSELLHKTWAELTHPDDLAADVAKFDQVTAGIIDSYSMDKRYIRKDGRAIDTTVSVRAMRKTDGAVDYFVALVQDISERKRSEAAEREQRTLAEALRDTAEALNSTLNFDDVLERILTNVQRVVPHDTATLILVENGIGRVVGGRGFANDVAQAVLRLRLPVDELPNLRRAMQSREPAIVADTRTEPDWMSFPETRWIRSNISAPIRQNEQVIGLLNLDSATPNHFTAAHKERLNAFAAQAAVALENARLLKETRQQLGELEALNAVSTALRSAQTLEKMLPILLDETLTVLHANTGIIRLYDAQRDELQAVVGRGWFAHRNAPLKPGQGIVGQVFSSGKVHISREFRFDPQADPQAVQYVPAGWGGACVPIRSAEAIAGVLFVAVELPRELSASEVQLVSTISEMAGTAIQRMSLHEQTTRRLQRLMMLQTIERTISSSFDVRLTLNVLLDQLITQLGVDAADVLLRAPATHLLEHVTARGYTAGRQQPLRLGEGLAGEAALERKIMTRHADEQEIRASAALQPESIDGFAVQIAIPLVAKAEVKGVLRVFQRAAFSPDREWLDFMEMLAGHVAIAVDNSQLFVGAQRSNLELALAYDTTLEGWSRALDLRDKETEGHTQRVAELTMRLARTLGIQDSELVHIRRGALLHDMGKMGVPDSILLKPGPLTAEEWVVMRRHPVYAYELLAPITFLRRALDIPYAHHEKWDGSGYPRGLSGEQIPLAARLFAVVDVWDALRSDRPYRAAWPEEKVREHIQALAGTHFDPDIVRAFLNLSV